MDFTSKLVSTHVRLSLTAAFVQEKKTKKTLLLWLPGTWQKLLSPVSGWK